MSISINRLRYLAFFSALTFALGVYAPALRADTSGVITVASGQQYRMTQNHVGTIRMIGDNSILFCDGHTIRGNGAQKCMNSAVDCGIEFTGQNSVARGCTVTGHNVGVVMGSTSNGASFYDSGKITGNNIGAYIAGKEDRVDDSIIQANGVVGILISGASDHTYIGNDQVVSNGTGSSYGGLVAVNSNFIRIDNSYFINNLVYNAYLGANNTIQLTGNWFAAGSNQTTTNLYVSNVNEVNLTSNLIFGAMQHGIYVSSSPTTTSHVALQSNTAFGDGMDDCLMNLTGPSDLISVQNSFAVSNGCGP